MRELFVIILLMTAIPAAAFGQSQGERRGWGYAFAGVGGNTGSDSGARFTAGGGGERLFYRGLGIGGEIGYLSSSNSIGDGIGIGSVNLAYHFNNAGKVAPFVTGGASAAFRGSSAAGGGNFGGGIQYWPKDHVGLRFEVRDHIFSSDSPHLFTFRVGVTFR
ncbi:MAG TPA: outer membrane beta-barrel protein [Blastocatellia bacterium]|nr:outer membrane beta-barrel protein [Blastocatellia bacterium]